MAKGLPFKDATCPKLEPQVITRSSVPPKNVSLRPHMASQSCIANSEGQGATTGTRGATRGHT